MTAEEEREGSLTVPLIAASVVFFSWWAAIPVLVLSGGKIHYDTILCGLSFVSLTGAVLFLRTTRHESPRWYWGVPFAAVCIALVLWTGVVRSTAAVPDMAGFILLFLLPPALAMLLYAIPDDQAGRVQAFLAFNAVIGAASLILAINALAALNGGPSPVPGSIRDTATILYTILLMPVIGLLLVFTGVSCR